MDAITVGIDVSKDRLDVAVYPSQEAFFVARNAGGLDVLVARLKAISPLIVALEATGGFETVVTATLAAAGVPVAIVNPAQVRAFAKAVGQRAKTDPIDAFMIARFADTTRPEPRALPDAEAQLLADLVQRRRQIIESGHRHGSKRASHGYSRHWKRSWQALIPTSTIACAARPSGVERKICFSLCQGSGQPSRER
jgi:transposase